MHGRGPQRQVARLRSRAPCKVIGRRLIECYAGVFHTVDHVEGILKEGFDSLDAFLSHMWAVTVIGAPKKAAAQTIETLEKDARGWYGGAVGMISLNGDINTGILIRTTYLRDGMASLSGGRHPALRFRPGHGRARDAAEGHRLLPHSGRGSGGDRASRRRTREARGRRRRACCWWTTTTASSTRWPTTRGRPAPKW